MENSKISIRARLVQIVCLIMLLAFLISQSGCAFPFSSTCPTNDRNYWKKSHFPKHKLAYYKWANTKPQTGNKTLF